MSSEPSDAFVFDLLSRLCGDRCTQVYLFGPSGEPFWAARLPLESDEIPILADVMSLVASAHGGHGAPLVAPDEHGRFVVGALDASGELYVALLGAQLSGAELDEARRSIAPHAESLRVVAAGATPGS